MNGILFRDTLLSMLLALTAIVILTVFYLNDQSMKNAAIAAPPGNMIVTVNWPEGDTDIDLWVFGPGEPKPVGYSNKGGVVWNLLRDDLGTYPDSTSLNYENAYTRGIIPGKYTINLQCYRCAILPQKVHVEVQLNTGDPDSTTPMKNLFSVDVTLSLDGQERTAANFELLKDGTIKEGSFNSVFVPLRSAGVKK